MLPSCQYGPGMAHRAEQRLIKAFIAQPPAEAFHEGVLRWLSRLGVMPLDPPLLRPLEDRDGGQFGAAIAD